MVEASSHVPLFSLVESTQRVYGVRIFFVSARTNKRHHHHYEVLLFRVYVIGSSTVNGLGSRVYETRVLIHSGYKGVYY
jgi:hypothetical protein